MATDKSKKIEEISNKKSTQSSLLEESVAAQAEATDIDEARRTLLERLTIFGAYATPTMSSLMIADKAAAQSGGSAFSRTVTADGITFIFTPDLDKLGSIVVQYGSARSKGNNNFVRKREGCLIDPGYPGATPIGLTASGVFTITYPFSPNAPTQPYVTTLTCEGNRIVLIEVDISSDGAITRLEAPSSSPSTTTTAPPSTTASSIPAPTTSVPTVTTTSPVPTTTAVAPPPTTTTVAPPPTTTSVPAPPPTTTSSVPAPPPTTTI